VLPRDLAALGDGARDGDRRLASLRAAGAARVLFGAHLAGGLEWRSHATWVDHENGKQSLPACAGPGSVELSPPPADERRPQAAAAGPAASGDHACVEGAAAAASALPAPRGTEATADRRGRRRARARRLLVGGDAGRCRGRSDGRGVSSVVVVRRVASRLDVRALSTALCGLRSLQQQQDPRA